MIFYLFFSCIVFFAGVVKGLTGFGAGLVALPLLALFLDIKLAIPLSLMLAAAGTIYVFFQLLKHMDWKEVTPLLIGFFPGVIIGVYFLKALDKSLLQIILGSVLISYAIYSVFLASSKMDIERKWGYLFGFLAGCLNGTIGAAGPPTIIYVSLHTWGQEKAKVILQGVFLITVIITLIIQAFSGVIGIPVIKLFVIGLPAFMIGAFAGAYFSKFLSDRAFKGVIYAMLAILGVTLIYKGIWH